MLPGYKFFAAAVCKVCGVVRQCTGVTLRAKRAAAVLGSPVCNQQGSSATIITSPATILYGTWGSSSSSSMVCFLLDRRAKERIKAWQKSSASMLVLWFVCVLIGLGGCIFCSCSLSCNTAHTECTQLTQQHALPWAAHSVSFKVNHGKTVASYGSRPWRRPQEQE